MSWPEAFVLAVLSISVAASLTTCYLAPFS